MKHIFLHACIAALLGSVVCAEKLAKPASLKVLVWNVWHGTNDVDQGPEKALALIRKSGADV
ncbi:MAG: endonuclease/exonuclease/phosphatase family protein, partial [Akkermansiaceae bacterium]